eukprot:363749-Chlamydomonas_euryale.AAC.9
MKSRQTSAMVPGSHPSVSHFGYLDLLVFQLRQHQHGVPFVTAPCPLFDALCLAALNTGIPCMGPLPATPTPSLTLTLTLIARACSTSSRQSRSGLPSKSMPKLNHAKATATMVLQANLGGAICVERSKLARHCCGGQQHSHLLTQTALTHRGPPLAPTTLGHAPACSCVWPHPHVPFTRVGRCQAGAMPSVSAWRTVVEPSGQPTDSGPHPHGARTVQHPCATAAPAGQFHPCTPRESRRIAFGAGSRPAQSVGTSASDLSIDARGAALLADRSHRRREADPARRHPRRGGSRTLSRASDGSDGGHGAPHVSDAAFPAPATRRGQGAGAAGVATAARVGGCAGAGSSSHAGWRLREFRRRRRGRRASRRAPRAARLPSRERATGIHGGDAAGLRCGRQWVQRGLRHRQLGMGAK